MCACVCVRVRVCVCVCVCERECVCVCVSESGAFSSSIFPQASFVPVCVFRYLNMRCIWITR